jgi:S1-C subfamily serine protease
MKDCLAYILLFFSLPLFIAVIEPLAADIPTFSDQDLQRFGDNGSAGFDGTDQQRTDLDTVSSGNYFDQEENFRKSSRSVAVVVAYDGEGTPIGYGSGFVVRSDGAVITSYHVIGHATAIKVKIQNRVFPVAGLLYVDKKNDIVLLKTNGNNFRALPLGDSDTVIPGQQIYIMGSPDGEEITALEGTVSGRQVLGANRRLLKISTSLPEGISGGPVLNEGGQVIGVATATVHGAENLNFAVPVKLFSYHISSSQVIPLNEVLSYDYSSSAGYWLEIAENHIVSERYPDAIDAYRKSLEIDSDTSSAHNGLGVAYLRL